jgi:transcriptional regulator with XRE-family HTH domain
MRYSNKIFSEAFIEILKDKKIKLRSLAFKTNLNYSYFSKLKKRKTAPPIETLLNIAHALEIDPEFFIEYRLYKLNNLLKNNPEILNGVIIYANNLGKELKVAEPKNKYNDDL